MTTIFATATGRPPAALAIIRISGSEAFAAAHALAGSLPLPRRAALRSLRDGAGELLDQSIVLLFPGPDSATGEDVVELHCHGGRAVIEAVERQLCTIVGLRRAEPGEFTRRALMNGRIDLAEAHGLADLLEAETEEQRVAAIAAVEGRVSRQVQEWIAALHSMAAEIEAELNFADDFDSSLDPAKMAARVAVIRASLVSALDSPPVERLKDGVRVVIAGPPNAGKSTLLNLLAERDAAIVSPVSGTTRDRIEAPVVRGGRAYLLIDTAGLNEAACAIEAEGVARATEAIAQSDVLLWLGDEAPPHHETVIWVQSRGDLADRAVLMAGRHLIVARSRPETIVDLWNSIDRCVPRTGGSARLTFHRQQRERVLRAAASLSVCPANLVLIADQVRAAGEELSGILGYGATENMLDSLFGRFCIGK